MMVNSTSPTLPPTRMVTASRTAAHMLRPSTRASSSTPRSSSVNTMSAAPRAADEPRPLTPIPTSAIRMAAASLAPSPTIAVTRPHRCRAATIWTFCSGLTRAKTCTSATILAHASSSRPASSAPVTTCASADRPSCRAMARAVTGWSPVISTTLRSASVNASIRGRADARAVSAKPT